MKLLSMIDFVLEQRELHEGDVEDFADLVCRYANFLKQPLELWMFVPCDEEGNILVIPDSDNYSKQKYYNNAMRIWYKAKERCLFEGFTIRPQGQEIMVTTLDNRNVWVNWNNSKTIEDLIYLTPQLTQTAIKQLGL